MLWSGTVGQVQYRSNRSNIRDLLSVFQLSERTFEGDVPESRAPPSHDKITTGNFWPTTKKGLF